MRPRSGTRAPLCKTLKEKAASPQSAGRMSPRCSAGFGLFSVRLLATGTQLSCWGAEHCRRKAVQGQAVCLSDISSPQMTEKQAAPGKDHKRPEEMETTKAAQDACGTPPTPKRQLSPAGHHKDQPLASRFVPFVAHFGGREPDSFKFLFYTPNCSNSYSPFYTAQRPTCGYHFCHDTDHTKKVTDVSSANIMKWRPVLNTKP